MKGRGTWCGRSKPPRSPAAASLHLGPLKMPGFAPGATHGTTNASLNGWPRSHTRTAPEKRCGGGSTVCGCSALVGTGVPPLSVPARGCAGAWPGSRQGSADTPKPGQPLEPGCARGCGCDGNGLGKQIPPT